MSELVLRQDHGHVARLVLNSPANFNALSFQMLHAIIAAFDDIATDDRIRAVILAGNGKAFCAGHDLRQMQAARTDADGGRAEYDRLFTLCARMMQMIPALPQPVIAQVHGIATAAGCQLVASCDMAIAAEGTRFGVNGVNIGLFCSTPMVALTRAIPPKAAFEMLTTGEFIQAARAQELGLINRVVPQDGLAQAADDLAQVIATKLPLAIRLGKQAFHRQMGKSLSDAYAETGATMCENMLSADTNEGITAFLEKRPPNWT